VNIINAASLMTSMKLNQWKSREEIEAIQEKKLRDTVSYASKHVPYYKKALKGKSVENLEDLAPLPITRKREIQTQTDSFISDMFEKSSLSTVSTSGSAGAPVTIFHHNSESHHGPVCEIHQLTEAGVSPFDLQVFMAPHGEERTYLIQRLGMFRRINVPALDDEKKSLLTLKKLQPRVIICLPSLLATMAYENMKSDIGFRIDKILSCSEMLSESTKKLVEHSFGCEVYDAYGAVETSWVAWQCEEGGLHLYSDSLVAEIVDDQGNPVKEGEYGNIVLTTLWKRSMPLIRYQVGDRAALGPECPCGRGLHTLKPIEGRADDFIVLPSGKPSPARFIHWVFYPMMEVLLFQAVQDSPGQVHVKIVPAGKPLSETLKKNIIQKIKESYQEPLEVTLEEVHSLPRGKTGKIKSVISKVKPDIL